LKTPDSDAHFYTAQELAQWLRVTEMTIYRMAQRGELPYVRVGRSLRFPSDKVRQLFAPAKTG